MYLPAFVHLRIGDEDKGIEYVKKLDAFETAEGPSRQALFGRWHTNAIRWYLWGSSEESLHRAEVYMDIGRADLAVAEFETAVNSLGRAGRNALLDEFRKAGVSVPKQAYAGSTIHVNNAISDYVSQAVTESSFSEFGSLGSTKQK